MPSQPKKSLFNNPDINNMDGSNSDQSEGDNNISADGEDSDEDDIQMKVGQGYLHETFNQRSDHDSRRFRVFQHYLRSDGKNVKCNRRKKAAAETQDTQWSSSSSSSDEKEE